MTEDKRYKRIKTKNGLELNYNIIMEKIIGRPVKPTEVVHHIDHNKTNDSPDNLLLCESRGIHQSIHQQFRYFAQRLAKELYKLKLIEFDYLNGIYRLNEGKIKSLNFLDDLQKKDFIKSLAYNKNEINQIKNRRKEIIEKVEKPKISFWDTIEGRRALKRLEKIDKETDREWQRKSDEEMLKNMYKIKKKNKNKGID